jgi:hypothetical protein
MISSIRPGTLCLKSARIGSTESALKKKLPALTGVELPEYRAKSVAATREKPILALGELLSNPVTQFRAIYSDQPIFDFASF